jgi:hypothetical protein
LLAVATTLHTLAAFLTLFKVFFNVHSFIMHIAMRSALLALLPLAVLGARKRDVASTPFQLYAYSEDIGGLPLFYADGLAYLGEPALSNSTDAAVVTCKFGFFEPSRTQVHPN